jgi:hypothetical protein
MGFEQGTFFLHPSDVIERFRYATASLCPIERAHAGRARLRVADCLLDVFSAFTQLESGLREPVAMRQRTAEVAECSASKTVFEEQTRLTSQ